MKFAFLVMCEFKGVKSTIDRLYKNLIKHYDADVFICVQKALPDDEERMNLFSENVVYRELYDKPDPATYFGEENNLNVMNDNWNIPSNLQLYINYHKMAKVIEKIYDKYDYFIIARTDSHILFPFPDKQLFEKVPKAMYFIDAKYNKWWGDIGIPGIIHKNYILDFLSCYYNIISNKEYRLSMCKIVNDENILQKSGALNQERFMYICLRILDIYDKIKIIENLNYFWTAEKIDDYTTWSKPHLHPTRPNIISKYDDQCNEAYDNCDLWNSGNFIWAINCNDFSIELALKIH
jgi:hypothetical protein